MSDFDAAIDALLSETWTDHPAWATATGVDGYDHELGDFSAASFERQESRIDHWIHRFEGFGDDALSFEERLDRDLVLSRMRGELVRRDLVPWRRSPDGYIGQCLTGVFSLFLHRVHPEEHIVDAAVSRLEQMPEVLRHATKNLDPSLVPPSLLPRSVGAARAGAAYARHMLPAEASDESARSRLAEAGEPAAQAFETFAAFLEDLRERATGDWAIGEARYSALLTDSEMLGYGAAEMRARGEAALARLEEEMRRYARDIAGTDDWRSVMDQLNADAPDSPEQMRDLYEEWTERARAFAYERGLVSHLEGERCEVVPAPVFQRPMLGVASYQTPPPFKPTKTGFFFVPFPPDGTPEEEVRKRLETNSRNSIPTISVHEAYPGHHWHLTRAQQNPRVIRKVLWTPYFAEGWALYAEEMMKGEGFFTDKRHEMCQVDARLFRAARIVVDTSLHTGDMSVEEAVTFMSTRASLTEPTARAEVARYCGWPTQAASYLTGSLEIERMQKRFLSEQRGTLREFNDRLAASGGLPIALAERALMGQ